MKKYMAVLIVFFSFIPMRAFGDTSDPVVRDFKTDEEESRAYNVVYTTKTVDGLTFTVQPDRPIEKVAGVYQPMDMDSYVALKFAKMQEVVNNVEAALNDKIDKLSQKVDELSAKVDELSRPQPVLADNAGNKTVADNPANSP